MARVTLSGPKASLVDKYSNEIHREQLYQPQET